MAPDRDSPPRRPTIVMGYGAFGRAVLRRLLASAAPRGLLAWEEPPVGARPGGRRLQDLVLMWMPDREGRGSRHQDEDDAREGSALEMLRDLYLQIAEVAATAPAEAALAEAGARAANQLLSASARARRGRSAFPLGLDVILVARPTGAEMLGPLDQAMTALMERLANNSNLVRGVAAAAVLNFIEILEFDNYWDRGASGRSIRRAVFNSMERWQARREAGAPAFGRVYLVDGRTEGCIRDETVRLDEIALFLELLLFEGQRAGELQRLFQPASPREALVATFGVRLMERSAGLLSRLAAARFSLGWLDYLAGDGGRQESAEPGPLAGRLAPFRSSARERLSGGEELSSLADAEIAALGRALLALTPEAESWPEEIRDRYEEATRQIEDRLSAVVRERLDAITREHLSDLPESLRAAVEAELHHPRRPVPLGGALAEVETALADLAGGQEPSPPVAGPSVAAFGRIGRLHARFQRLRSELVDAGGLRRLWPALALVMSVALSPLLVEVLGDLPRPEETRFLATKAYQLAQLFANPLASGALVFLLLWGAGSGWLQRRISRRLERTRRFYLDPERGRFAGRLRTELAPGGDLRAPIDHLLGRQRADAATAIMSEVRRELGIVADRLRERQREMEWLRRQLREFLQMHGLPPDGEPVALDRLSRGDSAIRYTLERGEDFERMLKKNPPGRERYFSTQATSRPFAGWDLPWGGCFLHPNLFLDNLARLYSDPFQADLARPGDGEEARSREFLTFLADYGSFDLAFSWPAQEGVPTDSRYCLMPALWQRLPGVTRALSDLRLRERSLISGAEVGRAYLLRLQTGVEARCLLAAETER
jgi:hypothetical protein